MAARSEIIPPVANFIDRCKTAELQLDQAFCSQVRMNASSRIKVDNELRAEPDSLRCCTRITGEDSRIFAFFCGSISAAAGLLFEYGKGTLHAGDRCARLWLLFD